MFLTHANKDSKVMKKKLLYFSRDNIPLVKPDCLIVKYFSQSDGALLNLRKGFLLYA